MLLCPPVEPCQIPSQGRAVKRARQIVTIGAKGGVIGHDRFRHLTLRRLIYPGACIVTHPFPGHRSPERGKTAEAGDRCFPRGGARIPAGYQVNVMTGTALQRIFFPVDGERSIRVVP